MKSKIALWTVCAVLVAVMSGCATCPASCPVKKACHVKRYGQVLRVKPEKFEEYKRLHAAVWPEILDMIHECNIRNYSIFHKDGYLFAYFEYVGSDFDADMAKMAADPKTQEWWAVCMPCQEPLPTRAEGEWWANMEEVFHTE